MGRERPFRTPGPATGYPETAGSLFAQGLRASEGPGQEHGMGEPDRGSGGHASPGAGETPPDDI